mgnify:CR=1 FL=1
MQTTVDDPVDKIEIDLRQPTVAAILAWLIPGAGHLYQRRYFKAALKNLGEAARRKRGGKGSRRRGAEAARESRRGAGVRRPRGPEGGPTGVKVIWVKARSKGFQVLEGWEGSFWKTSVR